VGHRAGVLGQGDLDTCRPALVRLDDVSPLRADGFGLLGVQLGELLLQLNVGGLAALVALRVGVGADVPDDGYRAKT